VPSIDVVITTYGRHGPLNRCLEALAGQSQPATRIIVVDDCSAPPVERTIPPAFAARLPLTLLRLERNGGPAAGRNAGVRACSSERVLFVDDDVVASPRLIERHASWHSQDPTVVVIGPLASPPDWKPTAWNLWEARKLEAEYRKMQAGVYAPTWRQFFTGNSSVQRTDLLAVGAFDERFTRAEDIELGIRLAKVGRRFVFDAHAVGWHYAVRTAESWLRIPGEYARFDSAIAKLHPELHWERIVAQDAAARHALTRGVSTCLGRVGSQRIGARAAVGVAAKLHSVGLEPLAQSLLSLAFALEYNASSHGASGSAEILGAVPAPLSNSTGARP
jgi:GT2 family glycosyltransferase